MTVSFVFSKALQILQRIWGIDTSQPLDRRADVFARAKALRIYSRNGVRVFVAPKNARNRD